MIIKKIITAIFGFAILIALVSCGGENASKDNSGETNPPKDNPSGDVDPNDDNVMLVSYKSTGVTKLNDLVNPVIEETSDVDLISAIQSFYETEMAYINGITDIEIAKNVVNKVIEDTKEFTKTTLKPLAIQKINSIINPLIEKITYLDLRDSVQEFYNTEIGKIEDIETLVDLSVTYKEILDDTKAFITSETEKVIIALKNLAIDELDIYVEALIDKIPYDTLKNDTQKFYNQEKKKLDDIDSTDGFEPCILEIKDDLIEFALTETKKFAVGKLEEVVNAGIEKIPNKDLKDDLSLFAKTEIAKLNAVNTIESVPTTLTTVISETEAYIRGLLVTTVKDYLTELTAVETATAYDYLPEAMSPTYSANIVNATSINYDFTSFTNVSDINKAGFGEQWQMVVENINQSVTMAKVFNVAQTALNSAGAAVNIYITNSYADEMSYPFNGTGFTGNFEFKNAKLIFNISLTESVSIPVLGSFKPVIKMEYDLVKEAKGMFISLGDSYKIKYVITDNAYEMATTYGLTIANKSASRSSYLSIEKNNGSTVGHIYEYTTYEGSDKIKACADFYVENGYVSVVGNKSSGIIGFSGYINELYLANEGRMIGYEVREELTVAGVTGTYNTLWFNLWDIQGISSVKVTDKTESNKSSKSTVDVYLNGSDNLLSPTYNSKLGVKTSRKYDIELRTRYYYTYDSETGTYTSNSVKVPMMFIQEGDNYNSFTSDISKDNKVSLSVSLKAIYLNKILADYDTLIDIFIANKDSMSSETIISYLEQYE